MNVLHRPDTSHRFYAVLLRHVSLLILMLMHGFMLKAQDTLVLKPASVYSGYIRPYVSYQKVETIDSAYLASLKGGTLSQVLTDRSAVYIKEYGNGMISTPSFRGTSAMHTALMWNGLPMLNPALGLTDLNIIPVSSGDRISVFYGQGSPVFGSGAIGGTITLQSAVLPEKGYNLEGGAETGSFGYHAYRASASAGYKKWSMQAGYYYANCVNNFSYFDPYVQKEKQQQAASWLRHGLTSQLQYRFNPKISFTLRGWYHYADRNLQPPMGTTLMNENQKDDDIRLGGELNWKNKLGAMQVRMAWFREVILYTSNTVYSYSLVNTLQLHVDQEVRLGKKANVMLGGNMQRFIADNTGYGLEVQSQNRGSVYALFRYQLLKPLKLMLNLRQQWVEDYEVPFTPGAGVEYTVLKKERSKLMAKLSGSMSYRAPTLNERFWVPGGNPDLLSEKGYSVEAGIVYEYKTDRFTIQPEVTLYHTRIKDWVQWMPLVSSTIYTPVNIAEVASKGVEMGVSTMYKAQAWKFSAGAQYAYTSSVTIKTNDPLDLSLNKQLIYVPLHRIATWLQTEWKGIVLQAQYQFTGYRYTTTDNLYFLPAYSLCNLRLSYQHQYAGCKAELFIKVNNLTDVSYQTVQNRALPGRSYQAGINIYFQHHH